ncbi:DUF2784 domain-containing protein [Rhodococcus sp. NPDC058521]|uniref:DUF2784 domain-containing protein n=1 Tax=Rhodococcus sp. NPDC058521 TaxID=3346536 RepID=UPI0036509033
MLYSVIADVTFAAHLAFISYVVVGGFVAWRFPRTLAVHVAAVAWGFGGIVFGYDCPLTALESWSRVHAGEAPLPSTGFIDHYLTGVIYPESAIGVVQVLTATLVLTSWIGLTVLHTRGHGHSIHRTSNARVRHI